MHGSIDRPSTPPPSSYLLTPPPSGGFDKHIDFVGFENTSTHVENRRLTKYKEGESPGGFFEKLQEGSDVEINNDSESEIVSSNADTPPASPSSDSSVTSRNSILKTHNPFAPLAFAINAYATITGPFPFLKLPLSVRKIVYEHLLVVSAIICVRQKHTSFHDEKRAFLHAERRELLPGIAYALAQLTVDGFKTRFSRFEATNINILCVNKEIHAEAKTILYGKNAFEIIKPTDELAPPPDYSVRLFPAGCQRLVTKLNIRIRSFYDLHWLLSGGYNVIKNYYRGLDTLTLILEMDSTSKGFGKQWARQTQEKWTAYVKRLHDDLAGDLFSKNKSHNTKIVPTWVDLRVLFSGESYDEKLGVDFSCSDLYGNGDVTPEQAKRAELKNALQETWELFKKGGK